jgi:hypothetical protein
VGEGRTAIIRAFRGGRSGRPLYAGPRPSCVAACNAPLRREQVKLQVGLANSLYHSKGIAAAETISAFNQARVMIQEVESLGEHVEDPLLLYSVLYGFFIPKFMNFDGDAASALARGSSLSLLSSRT